jgi:phosphoglycerate dehydrogenase-like enzyme
LGARGFKVARCAGYEDLIESGAMADAEIFISNFCPGWALEAAPKLHSVINMVTGSELIDSAAAARLGIVIGIGQAPENYEGMAEGTIMLILNALKDMPRIERALREQMPRPHVTARQLMGKTVGLIGFGLIAQGVARRLQGWDVQLLVAAPRLRAALPPGAKHVELDALLAASDVVVVLCSLNDSTRGLIGPERIARMKQGAVLVNSARGGIVDEDALYQAARDSRLGYLALDAFSHEPLPMNSPLRALPNAILTPHMAGHTMESEEAILAMAVENVARVMSGAPPLVVLNPEVLPHWAEKAPI